MHPVERAIRRGGLFLRRRDLLALGFTDARIGAALEAKRIFRVRQGWYSVPDAPEAGIRAVRIGGRLTALSALESYGIRVPRPRTLQVAVPPTASRLRNPHDRHARLSRHASVTVFWGRRGGTSPWRVSVPDALLAVLSTEGRDVAVAACSAALRANALTPSHLAFVFARAPLRVRDWHALVSVHDESHGETFARLWFRDAGIACEQQVHVAGAGFLDFRLRPLLFFEVDGAQHGEADQWRRDRERDLVVAALGGQTIRVTYEQLLGNWPAVLATVRRAIADADALAALRRAHPYRPPPRRKRRRSRAKAPPDAP